MNGNPRSFEGYAGAHNYSDLTASNGMEALQPYELAEQSFSRVMSDLVMPKWEG